MNEIIKFAIDILFLAVTIVTFVIFVAFLMALNTKKREIWKTIKGENDER